MDKNQATTHFQSQFESVFGVLFDEGHCRADMERTLTEMLASETHPSLAVYGDLLSQIAMGNFLFSETQLAEFGKIVERQYEGISDDQVRMQALILIRTVHGFTASAVAIQKMLHYARSINLPIAELVWELHHMLRRNEVDGEIAAAIKCDLKQSNAQSLPR